MLVHRRFVHSGVFPIVDGSIRTFFYDNNGVLVRVDPVHER